MVSTVLSTSAYAAVDHAERNLTVQAATGAVQKDQRLALVIGNSAYRTAPLVNPVNDAKAMSQALELAGFKVILRTDVDHRTLLEAVRDFGNRLRQGGVGVFYYAGHGMQIKGRNYLIPVSADIQREDEVAYAALDAQAVLDKMESAANGANLLILDACRNNPFSRSFRSSVQGLAQMEAPVGTLVAFSTAPGSVASDGAGSNGLYTQHLLSAMRTPGAKVEDVFKRVRAGVRKDSEGKQIPWEATSLEGDLYFTEPKPQGTAPVSLPTAPQVAVVKPTSPSTPTPDASGRAEEIYWATLMSSKHAADLVAYLSAYPQGRFVAQARARLAELSAIPAATEHSVPAVAVAAFKPDPPVRPQQASVPNPPQRNAIGYTTGDRWNYQIIDKYSGEVIENYTTRVGKIEKDGSWRSPGGQASYDAHGRLKTWVNSKGERRSAIPNVPRWWPNMKVGETQSFVYDSATTTATGEIVNRLELEGKVLGIETVKVPAGEFQAWRIEYSGNSTRVNGFGRGRVTLTTWYVPELRTMVAFEELGSWNGRPDVRRREELTSFNLANEALNR